MEDTGNYKALKEKLLAAGIDEIALHGVSGFSLRRVAAACGASCAAPYKHFKNKEEFIMRNNNSDLGIILQVIFWGLLILQVYTAFFCNY